MVEYSDPIPTRASKVAVSTFAEQLAINLEFKAGDPLDPLVSQLSGKITYRNPIGAEKPESIRIEPTGEFEIFLPSVTSLGRDRFTIAHELGHLFLHFPLVQNSRPENGMKATRWVDETNQDLQRCEWEANWFAASFVMPSGSFREACRQYGSISTVASIFGVTEAAVRVRASTLNVEALNN